jgi:hypothetical protein
VNDFVTCDHSSLFVRACTSDGRNRTERARSRSARVTRRHKNVIYNRD